MARSAPGRARRVVTGNDASGLSCVVADGIVESRTDKANGAVIEEIWFQDRVPARPVDDGRRGVGQSQSVPPNGVCVRLFTVPPGTSRDSEPMHSSETVGVITVVSAEAYLVLETGEVRLERGDSVVLDASMHTWRNPSDQPAVLVSTAFHKTAVSTSS